MYFNLTTLVLCFFPASLMAVIGTPVHPDSRFAVPVVNAGDTAFICPGDTLDLSTLGASIVDNGSNTADGLWSSASGTFSPDNTFANALAFVPSPAQIAAGEAVLRLSSTFDPLIYDEVIIQIHQQGMLVCNSAMEITLDEDCITTVTAQMILTGPTYDHYEFYQVQLSTMTNVPLVPATSVNGSHIGQMIKATVTDICSGNSCWGQLSVADDMAPVLTCTDFNIACAQSNVAPAFLLDSLGITAAYPSVVENCTVYTQSWTDVWADLPCPSPVVSGNETGNITRTWMVTDAAGNTRSCTQVIHIIGLRGIDVKFPADQQANCTTGPIIQVPYATFTYPSGVRTYPLWPNSQHCEVEILFSDVQEPVCDGSYSIQRTWTVVDDCLPSSPYPPLINPIDSLQIITVSDISGPQFTCPAHQTYPIPADQCCAAINLPDVVITDNCSRINHIEAQVTAFDPLTGESIGTQQIANNLLVASGTPGDTLGQFGTISCLFAGTHTVRYTATDDCGNHSSCTFQVTVVDTVPPVAVCDEWTFVGLGLDGITYVNAESFDDGSYDNCGAVFFKVRNLDGRCQPTTFFFDEAKFCCTQTGDTVQVILRVYDVPPAPGAILSDTLVGHYNECMVQVVVEDKIKPVCTAPANVTISCDLFDPSLTAYGAPLYVDNNICCAPTIAGTVNYSQFDTLCNRGTISRNWIATDCAANTSSCTQKVVVTHDQYYFLKFPADKIVSECNGPVVFGEPEFFGESCELLATSYTDEVFTTVPDACYKVERTWTVINWCTYVANQTCVYVPNPDVLAGPIVSEPGNNVLGWTPSILAVNGINFDYGLPGFTTGYPQHGGWNRNANCYQYKQIVKVIDTVDPTVVTPSSSAFCDYSTNDANYWNAGYWYSATYQSHNLAEGTIDLSITATDACSGANLTFRYELFLDMNGDSIMETVVPGSITPAAFNEVRFNNINTPGYTGGNPQAFDFRAVPANQKQGFGMVVDTAIGNTRAAHVRWKNQAGNITLPQITYGTHKIKWFITDNCGNETVNETIFTVNDCKKPTVVCVNGLSVPQMNQLNNSVTLWTTDFLSYGEDNATQSNLLHYYIRKSGTGTGVPTTTSVVYNCNELGTNLVEVWAVDIAGNADFCETSVILQDNTGVCSNQSNITLSGSLKTETAQGVEGASVTLNGGIGGSGPITLIDYSSPNGDFGFSSALPAFSNASITPIYNGDPLNGVNTWDLVLISRHILGLEPLDSPYKIIAADANKSGTVSTFDIVELRKLILGTYTDLPSNNSWRFVDESQVFTIPENPFADTIREVWYGTELFANYYNANFVGVKIGDVDNSVVPGNFTITEDRAENTLFFEVEDRQVKAGETFTVNFKAADKVAGYQFTMNINGLDVVDVVPGEGMSMDNFALHTERSRGEGDAITTSVCGMEGIEQGRDFSVTFHAKQAGSLSDMLGISSRITKTLAFLTSGSTADIAFRFKGKEVDVIASQGFELYQNVPNPFKDKTTIGFYLPESGVTHLRVLDAVGHELYFSELYFEKGYHSVQLDRKAFGASTGMMYYQLETANHIATMPLIMAE